MQNKIKVAILGFGNIGKDAVGAVQAHLTCSWSVLYNLLLIWIALVFHWRAL